MKRPIERLPGEKTAGWPGNFRGGCPFSENFGEWDKSMQDYWNARIAGNVSCGNGVESDWLEAGPYDEGSDLGDDLVADLKHEPDVPANSFQGGIFVEHRERRGALRYRARTIPAKGRGSKLAQTHDFVSVF